MSAADHLAGVHALHPLSLCVSDVPPEQRNVYSHFEPSEEERRMLKHNNTLQTSARTGDEDGDATQHDTHPALRAIAHVPTSTAAAAAPSSSTGADLNPLGFPLKQEVKFELAEMDACARAAIGLRRLAEEEAEILRNQLANLDTNKYQKQI